MGERTRAVERDSADHQCARPPHGVHVTRPAVAAVPHSLTHLHFAELAKRRPPTTVRGVGARTAAVDIDLRVGAAVVVVAVEAVLHAEVVQRRREQARGSGAGDIECSQEALVLYKRIPVRVCTRRYAQRARKRAKLSKGGSPAAS